MPVPRAVILPRLTPDADHKVWPTASVPLATAVTVSVVPLRDAVNLAAVDAAAQLPVLLDVQLPDPPRQ